MTGPFRSGRGICLTSGLAAIQFRPIRPTFLRSPRTQVYLRFGSQVNFFRVLLKTYVTQVRQKTPKSACERLSAFQEVSMKKHVLSYALLALFVFASSMGAQNSNAADHDNAFVKLISNGTVVGSA